MEEIPAGVVPRKEIGPGECARIYTGAPIPAGTRIGDFEIRRVIGWGGSGIVYEAYDPGLDRVVALKELFLSGHARRNGLEVEPAKLAACCATDAFMRHLMLMHNELLDVREAVRLPSFAMKDSCLCVAVCMCV